MPMALQLNCAQGSALVTGGALQHWSLQSAALVQRRLALVLSCRRLAIGQL
jgi:hypothetical protein